MSSPHRLPLCSLLLLLSLLALFPYECMGDADCDPHQRNLLLELKLGFNFSSLDHLDSWRAGSNCCKWEGVACDSVSGLITELDLGGLNISGEIDSSLFKLASLQKLNLAHNKFNQSFPNEFELLSDLVSLNLSHARFFGQIPVGIARLTNLVTLDLSTSSRYVSAPPWYVSARPTSELENPNFDSLIRDLNNLRELSLDGVNISASGLQWSAAVGRWTPKLRVLSLEGCSITGHFDPSLSKLGDLSVLRLANNELNCSVPEFFGNFSSLTVLDLVQCGLNGTFPENVFLLKNLTDIDLSGNDMLSGSLPEFADETKLESLVLGGTNFSGPLPCSVGKLKYLIKLVLGACEFSGMIPTSIANLTQLSVLDLSYNHFICSVPSVLPPGIAFLDLSYNRLNSSIPTSMGKLQHLKLLCLTGNLLSGEIPGSMFLLPALQYLYLRGNQLSGQLQGFSNGSSLLEEVDLGHNMLQGEFPRFVFQLSRLNSFSVASNNFSGEVSLDQFGVLRNLGILDLSYNSLSIKDVDDNNSLSLLKFIVLKLASCNLTRVPSFLRYQDEIAIIDLSNNKIHGAIPSWIWSFGDGLQVLNLAGNFFTSLEPFLLDSNMSMPISLDLHSNLLSGPIPLPRTRFEMLDYSNNNFSLSIPSNISLLDTSFFSLANNSLTGEIPPSICDATVLEFLDLSGNRFNGMIPPCLLGGNKNLKVLNLQGNELRGRVPPHIGKGCGLLSLHLNGNHLEGQLPDSLVNCNELEVIDLGNNHIHDSFPFWLTRIPSLRILVLRSNEFYGPIELHSSTYAASFSLPSLQIFDISSNSFNGSLPLSFFMSFGGMMAHSARNPSSVLEYEYHSSSSKNQYTPTSYDDISVESELYQDSVTVTSKGSDWVLVKILTIFTSIDLSNNAFTGEIPDVFGKLQALHSLNLSHNSLTGQIPLAFKNMEQLESLDLSKNHLSGEIPQELASLTFLSFLNLSCNDLVGRIPQGNQFSTFSNSSFGGNEGLCGFPLSKQCLNVTPIVEQTEPASESDSGYAIVVALCTGIGYGVGIAIVLVLPNVSWGRNISPLVSRDLASISAWIRRAATNARKKLMKATEETTPRT